MILTVTGTKIAAHWNGFGHFYWRLGLAQDVLVTLHRYNNGFSAAEELLEMDVPIDATDSIDVRLRT